MEVAIMDAETTKEMCSHLEFLGYEVAHEGDLVARHDVHLNFLMRPLAGGILLAALVGGGDRAKRDRPGYLDFINSLNARARVARFYADEDSDLCIEAWYPDHYERSGFGAFMEVWNRDCMLLAATSEAVTYLR